MESSNKIRLGFYTTGDKIEEIVQIDKDGDVCDSKIEADGLIQHINCLIDKMASANMAINKIRIWVADRQIEGMAWQLIGLMGILAEYDRTQND